MREHTHDYTDAYLEVGQRSVQPDAPVNETVSSVENTLLVKRAKGLDHSF